MNDILIVKVHCGRVRRFRGLETQHQLSLQLTSAKVYGSNIIRQKSTKAFYGVWFSLGLVPQVSLFLFLVD